MSAAAVNSSTTMPAFLLMLALTKGGVPMYGRQLAMVTGVVEDTVYPTLRRLEKRGFLASEVEQLAPEDHRSARRFYWPTAAAVLEVDRMLTLMQRIEDACDILEFQRDKAQPEV